MKTKLKNQNLELQNQGIWKRETDIPCNVLKNNTDIIKRYI